MVIIYFFVNFVDNNDDDIHRIIVNADTNAVIPNIYGHSSGSVVNIDYEPFIGTTEIEIIVNDFGIVNYRTQLPFL